jgi:hypothetical protein
MKSILSGHQLSMNEPIDRVADELVLFYSQGLFDDSQFASLELSQLNLGANHSVSLRWLYSIHMHHFGSSINSLLGLRIKVNCSYETRWVWVFVGQSGRIFEARRNLQWQLRME